MTQSDIIERTISKMIKSQEKKKEITEYLEKEKPHLLWSIWKKWRIKECCNVLAFRDYLNWEKKLYKANFCKYDKFCLACATRRAIKMIQRFEAWIIQYNLDKKNRYHITLTIKHNQKETLGYLMDKLWKAKEKLSKSFRNSKRESQKTKSFIHNFDWIVSSVEITYSEKNGWHPHIHMLVCTNKEIPIEYSSVMGACSNRELQKERYKFTGDSYHVSIRKIDVNKWNYDRRWIWEVFKYAVKFSKLDVPHLAEVIAIQQNRHFRFFSTYWIFRWRQLEKNEPLNRDSFIEKTFVYCWNDFIEEKELIETKA